MNNIYYLKYQKYKIKYLKLKILEQNGGNNDIIKFNSKKDIIKFDSKNDEYIIKFYSMLDNLIDKQCFNTNKYNFEKLYGQFFINLYNNKNNESIDFKLFIEQYNKLCNKKFNIDHNISDYIVENIFVETLSIDNKYIYTFKINYLFKNKHMVTTIHSQLLKSNIIYKTSLSIGNILLLYNILGLNSGIFWGLLPQVYNLFINNNSMECFASPFNHTLNNYYSLLDIDKQYGSQGNFFDNFMESKYTTYIMNPPFTSDIILKMFDYIKNKLDVDKCCIYLYIPAWNDINDPFYDEIKKKYTIIKHNLIPSKSYVYNYIKEERFIAKFETTIFLITNDYTDVQYNLYKKIINIMTK